MVRMQIYVFLFLGFGYILFLLFPKINSIEKTQNGSLYIVKKLNTDLSIDGNWYKQEWQNVEGLNILNHMGSYPHFFPKTKVKLLYDEEHLYGIFLVEDRFVQCVVEENNGPVYEDSCVEFFFSPDENNPLFYFNLEMNCGGVALMQFATEPRKKFNYILPSEIAQVEIAHSLPNKVFPEIQEEVLWTIEFKLPFTILSRYSTISYPKPGVVWKGNFYKTASKTSNPHYITWSFIDRPNPDFHLPEFFGSLVFQ